MLTFDSLPDDVLGEVLKYLTSAETLILGRVCRHLHDVVRARYANVDLVSSRAPPEQVLLQLKRFPGTEMLRFEWVTDALAREIPVYGARLRSLWIDGADHLTDEGLENLLTGLNHLASFHVNSASHLRPGSLRSLAHCARSLTALYIQDSPSMDGAGLEVLTALPRLQALHLGGEGLTDDAVAHLLSDAVDAARLPPLTSLALVDCESLQDRTVAHLLRRLPPTLMQLDVRRCKHVGRKTLSAVAACCPRLLSLHVGATGVHAVDVAGALPHCPRLRSLSVQDNARVDDAVLLAAAASCPALTSLDCGSCPGITDSGLQALAAGMAAPGLRTLHVYCCEGVTDAGLLPLLQRATALRTLNIGGTRQVQLSAMRVRQASVSTGAAGGGGGGGGGGGAAGGGGGGGGIAPFSSSPGAAVPTSGLPDASLARLTTLMIDRTSLAERPLFDLLSACWALETLHVGWVAALTDEMVLRLCRQCRCLRVLHVEGTNITAAALAELPSTLRELHVGWCDKLHGAAHHIAQRCPSLDTFSAPFTRLHDAGAIQLAAGCRQLRTLNLRAADVGDAGVTALARANHRLERLYLGKCRGVTDAALVELGRHCPRLRALGLGRCHRVTDDGMAALAAGCTLLRDLDLFGCAVTERGLQALCRSQYDIRCHLTAHS